LKSFIFALFALVVLAVTAPLHAQDAGSAGAQVLQFLPGSRAAAFSGAYTAIAGDADAIFYNAAGIASLRRAGTLAYESYVSDVAYGSLGVASRFGGFTIGASVAFLNAGEIEEVVPDEEFGGNHGQSTGNTLSASETALRVVAAIPLMDGRLRAGAAVGFVATAVAEQRQQAPLADIGVQYDVGIATLGATLRNFGTDLSGDAVDKLPTEARFGAATHLTREGSGILSATGEVIARLGEGSVTFAAGVEAGLPATTSRPFTILARAGFDAESHQLGALRAGATLGFRDVAFDYTFQSLEFFGAVHRFGLRVNRGR
jgi:hypothetical protein